MKKEIKKSITFTKRELLDLLEILGYASTGITEDNKLSNKEKNRLLDRLEELSGNIHERATKQETY